MKISRNWLQTYFDDALPGANEIADALTFHAFEIDGVDQVSGDQVLDVKVTPNRGHDALSHRAIAKEIAAMLNLHLKRDVFREPMALEEFAGDEKVVVVIDKPELCPRYIAGYIRGVQVGPSPDWLRERLEAIGQRSINNVVDATNYVMFDLGQPLHAFDAGRLTKEGGVFSIRVRSAKAEEKMVALDNKEYAFTDSNLLITDAHTDTAIGIAGVKGGKPAEVHASTTDIIIESANFEGVSVRKTAQALKLRTDASARFEQVISPESAGYGMRAAVDLILSIAGGTMLGATDVYPAAQKVRQVAVSADKVNRVLGTSFSKEQMFDALKMLDLTYDVQGEAIAVTVPFERLDLVIPEDLIEEIGRIIGYENVIAAQLGDMENTPAVNPNFYAAERTREDLLAKGYSEVYTSVFTETGEEAVSNKIGGDKPFLRSTLLRGLEDALERNTRMKDVIGISEVRLFEIGPVWRDGKEEILVGTVGESEEPAEMVLAIPETPPPGYYDNLPVSELERYKIFSRYPFVVRDIALWVPTGTKPEELLETIRGEAGEMLVRSELFDTYEKGERTSYAFHLIYQSFDRTLTDVEVNEIMDRVQAVLKEKGYEIR